MLKEISEFIANNTIGTIISTLIILGGYAFLKYDGVSVIKSIFSRKRTNLNLTEKDITHHEIFNYIDFWISSKIPAQVFKTEFRNLVFRDYATIYYTEYKKTLKSFVKSGAYKEMDTQSLKKEFFRVMTDTIKSYESEFRKNKIPDIVFEKMTIHNNANMNLSIDLSNSICESEFYDSEDNLLKVYSFLNIILSILENTVNNSIMLGNKLNGELSGLEYKGVKEPIKSK